LRKNVTRTLTNVFALLAAVMLPLQLPICVCADAGHPHSQSDRSHSHPHDAVPTQHEEHAHQASHSHAAGHSHDSGDHHSATHRHAASEPTSDGEGDHDSHPCQCGPEKVPVGPLPKSETLESLQRYFGHWIGAAASVTNAMIPDQARPLTPPFWLGMNTLSTFQGNPCALLCRWVI
jgi:hypothetical protein